MWLLHCLWIWQCVDGVYELKKGLRPMWLPVKHNGKQYYWGLSSEKTWVDHVRWNVLSSEQTCRVHVGGVENVVAWIAWMPWTHRNWLWWWALMQQHEGCGDHMRWCCLMCNRRGLSSFLIDLSCFVGCSSQTFCYVVWWLLVVDLRDSRDSLSKYLL